MKTDIILAGVGGQGILSIATVIGIAAVKKDYNLKQVELHGMSQRGGAVQSHLRISDKEIASDMITLGNADIILSVEPMEALRYITYLSKTGMVVTSSNPFINIPNYPDLDALNAELEKYPNLIKLDADKMAEEAGAVKASNMVMLGAIVPLLPFSEQEIEDAIREIFFTKGEKIQEININAMKMGLEYTRQCSK